MSGETILVIDDSATIRRLVDSHLSQAGYRVVLAPTAEDGLRLAEGAQPDLIILDHQLPGTTGSEVARQLLDSPHLAQIPVVVSSTLRNKAYSEYTDMANVVDMLPKPYAPELLKTIVENAVETGKLIVDSQSQGTAVPEIIGEMADASLAGTFSSFSLREVLDFLNNGLKHGVLEVETTRDRIWFHLDGGRLQAVTAASVDPQEIAGSLPQTLRELAPVLKFTIGGRSTSELDGLVGLLDKKVIDPRLLGRLLRHQSAVLTRRCFVGELKTFRFEAGVPTPPLYQKVPLNLSLVALLVDAALNLPPDQLPPETEQTAYVRRTIRGQNLDRTGLAAQHMKLLGELAEPAGSADVANRLGMDRDEVRRVLHALAQADLVQIKESSGSCRVFALESDPDAAGQLRELLAAESDRYTGKVVRDVLGLQLLLKRTRPDAVLLAMDDDGAQDVLGQVRRSVGEATGAMKWVGVVPAGTNGAGGLPDGFQFDAVLSRPYGAQDVVQTLDRLFAG